MAEPLLQEFRTPILGPKFTWAIAGFALAGLLEPTEQTPACGAGRILSRTRAPALRYSFRRHYRVRPWTDRMEIYWGKHSQGYATGISDSEVCVAVASHNAKLRLMKR